MLWHAQDVYRTRQRIRRGMVFGAVLEVLGFLSVGRWDLAVLFVGAQALLIWAGVQGLRWLGRRGRTWWRTVGLTLLLGTIGGGLVGCADTYKGLARIYGCDPVAVEAGYCTMPKGASR